MDLDTNNYSLQELKSIVSLSKKNPSVDDIHQKVDEAILIVRKENESLSPNEYIDVILFFNKIKDKLISDHMQILTAKQPLKLSQHHKLNLSASTYDVNTSSFTPQINQDIQINPKKRNEVIQLINIDTIFRKQYDNTKSTDFIYEFKNQIKNVISLKLVALEIPNVWKTFDSESNYFHVLWKFKDITDPDDTTDIDIDHPHEYFEIKNNPDNGISGEEITIPEGNYNVIQFQTTLKNIFNDLNIPINVLFDQLKGLFIFTPYHSSSTGIASNNNEPEVERLITRATVDDFNFVLIFGTYNSTRTQLQRFNETKQLNAGYKIGFRDLNGVYKEKEEYYDTVSSVRSSNIFTNCRIANTVFGTAEDTYFYVCIDDFQNNSKNTVITENNIENILGRITVSSDSNTVILDNTSDLVEKSREYFGPVTLQKVRIQIKSKYGNILDINNENYNFALEVKQIYE